RYGRARAAARCGRPPRRNGAASSSRAAAAGPGARAAPGAPAAGRRGPGPCRPPASAPPDRGSARPWPRAPRRTAWSELLRRVEDLGDMAADLDLAPHPAHHPVLVDEEGAAVDAHVFAAVHAFLDPYAVFLADLAGGVGGQGEG